MVSCGSQMILLLGCISFSSEIQNSFLFWGSPTLLNWKGEYLSIFKDRSWGEEAVKEGNTFSGKLNYFQFFNVL